MGRGVCRVIRTGLFQYVPFHKIAAFLARGWLHLGQLPEPVHGTYAVLMWHCECGEFQP